MRPVNNIDDSTDINENEGNSYDLLCPKCGGCTTVIAGSVAEIFYFKCAMCNEGFTRSGDNIEDSNELIN